MPVLAQRPFHRVVGPGRGRVSVWVACCATAWRAGFWGGATAPACTPAARYRRRGSMRAGAGFPHRFRGRPGPEAPGQSICMAAHASMHADAPVPMRRGAGTMGIGLLGQWPVGRFSQASPGASAVWRGGVPARVGAGGLHCGGQQGRAFCAIVQRLAQGRAAQGSDPTSARH